MKYGLIAATLFVSVLPAYAESDLPSAAEESSEAANITSDEAEIGGFYKAQVVRIVEEREDTLSGNLLQIIVVKMLNGPEKGQEFEIEYGGVIKLTEGQKVEAGEKIIVGRSDFGGELQYFVVDKDRLTPLILIFVLFAAFVFLVGRLRGFTSLLGLIFSLGVLALYVVPKIVNGANPLFISFTGSLIIAVVSLYMAHGFNKKTSVALLSTVTSLVFAIITALVFVKFVKLLGLGSEEAYFLQLSAGSSINLQGLLLGAIVIGALGVLDDITVSQTAAIYELKDAKPDISRIELMKRGLSIGREHIASLVNTLALAYAGASLPLFMLFSIGGSQPLWVSINSEFVAEELVRTLAGAVSLIAAVPISTYFAAKFLSKPLQGQSLQKD